MIKWSLCALRAREIYAHMAELVDALASGASEHYARGGSSPLVRTKQK